jgi:integral membrane sensor domain MASE1
MWRRRHLNLRTVVVVIVLSSLLAPEAAAIIGATL